MVRAKTWRDDARCFGIGDGRFFDEEMHDDLVEGFCTPCPARRECLAAALAQEDTSPAKHRFGTRAGLTPAQRYSVYKRACADCPKCYTPIDPLLFITGKLRCDKCKWKCTVQPIPADGDEWQERHSLLAARVVAWLVENVKLSAEVPSPHALAKIMGKSGEKKAIPSGSAKADVGRVYAALIYAGTLEQRGTHYYRIGQKAAMKAWRPPHLAV